jgi:TonB family protein
MTAYIQSDQTFFSSRTSALVAIIGVHVAVIYAFATGLGSHFIREMIPPPMTFDFIKDTRPTATLPPPPKFEPAQPRKIDLGPPPDVPIDDGPGPDAIQQEAPRTVVDSIPAQLPPPAPVKRVLGGPDKAFPNSEDYYPPSSKRLGEQGNTTLQVCVGPSGKLTAEPTVTQSSGSANLDGGAIKLAKAGSGHYRATTENGTPVSSCYGLLIRFNLK